MRDHGKLSPQFWIGDTGRRFRGDAVTQVVALYLISSPHATMIGLYYLPLHLIAHETGQPMEAVQEALRKIEDAGFAQYDAASEHVWIPQMARHQIGPALKPGDKRVGWVRDLFEQVAKRPFARDFLTLYGGPFRLGDHAPCHPPSKGDRRGLGRGIDGASMGHPGSSGGDGDRDGDRDTHEPLPGAFGVCDESSTPPNTEQGGEPDDDPTAKTRAREPDEAFADDQHGFLLGAWNAARKKSRLPAEPLTDRHREAFSALLVATDGDRELATGAIDAYLGWRDTKLVEAWWSINIFPHRLSACVAKAEAQLARTRRSNGRAAAATEPEEPVLPPEEAQRRMAGLRSAIGKGAAHAAPTEA